MAVVLAHQGGWDEIAFVAIPIVVILGLLRFAKYRIDKDRAAADEAAPAGDEVDGTAGGGIGDGAPRQPVDGAP